jgi:hypothetical protein
LTSARRQFFAALAGDAINRQANELESLIVLGR